MRPTGICANLELQCEVDGLTSEARKLVAEMTGENYRLTHWSRALQREHRLAINALAGWLDRPDACDTHHNPDGYNLLRQQAQPTHRPQQLDPQLVSTMYITLTAGTSTRFRSAIAMARWWRRSESSRPRSRGSSCRRCGWSLAPGEMTETPASTNGSSVRNPLYTLESYGRSQPCQSGKLYRSRAGEHLPIISWLSKQVASWRRYLWNALLGPDQFEDSAVA